MSEKSAGCCIECWVSAGLIALKPAPVLVVSEVLLFSLILFFKKFMEIELELIRAWLYHIGEPEKDHHLVLNKCRRNHEVLTFYLDRANESKGEERRAKVLAILAENPKTQRAIITDLDNDPDNVILTVAIRSHSTFEMVIPKSKFDSFVFLELVNKGAVQ